MKKLLCFIAIIILFVLGVFPVVLRIVLPDKQEEKRETNIKRLLLSCSSDKYVTATNYDGDKIAMIIIKKINTNDDTNVEIIEETEENITSDLDADFSELRTKGEVLHQEVNDGEILTIDFSVSEHPNLILNNLNNKIEVQKEIYERQGLKCTIRE